MLIRLPVLIGWIFFCVTTGQVLAENKSRVNPGNFGLPGIIYLPTAQRFQDGELNFTHQNDRNTFMTGIAFQALPRLGVSFRYSGLGVGGPFAQDRITWDRSFDAHLSVADEGKYLPAISIGLRDFIGTGWYSSEYIVGTKNFNNLELTVGAGFGRLSGRDPFPNPLSALSSRFDNRKDNNFGKGGTFGTINWFQGNTSAFYGLNYQMSSKITLSSEYVSDLMSRESSYSDIKSAWNYGIKYQINDYASIAGQYLNGSQFSLIANVQVNPNRPPLLGGKELAPVPMRKRKDHISYNTENNQKTIEKVLIADDFQLHHLAIQGNTIRLVVTNTKFRSTAQAIGRLASNLQRFTSDDIEFADISFENRGLQVGRYQIDLRQVTHEQFNPVPTFDSQSSIIAMNLLPTNEIKNKNQYSWGIGPYITHRLFNPDLPLSLETGLELAGAYHITPGLKVSGNLRKSVITNLTDNKRRSNSVLPRVHSDWPLYDFAGQKGHIHKLTLSYIKNFAPNVLGRVHAGLLEPFFAGIGGELLYKPPQSPFALGFDIHHVRKRNYDMQFDLLDYETIVGHFSIYYDSGRMFEIELNAGKYLAGDWGLTTNISRKFGSGWKVGGYATLTDVPFATFGEGSFDKAIYVSIPIDWVVSSPTKAKRRLTLRPITRDGGANLASARSLYKYIEETHNASFKREYGRLWK